MDECAIQRLIALATHRHGAGDFDGAIAIYQAGQITSRAFEDHESYAQCTFQLGRIASAQGKPNEAISIFRDAIRVFIDAGSDELAQQARLALSFVLYDNCQYDDARHLLDEIERESANENILLGRVYGYRGNIERACGNYHEAKELYHQACVYLEDQDDIFYATFLMDLGILLLLLAEPRASRQYLERAERITTKSKPLSLLIEHYLHLANLALGQITSPDFDGQAESNLHRYLAKIRQNLVICFRNDDSLFSPASRDACLAKLNSALPSSEHARLSLKIARLLLNVPNECVHLRFHHAEKQISIDGSAVQLSITSAEWKILAALGQAKNANQPPLCRDGLISLAWPKENLLNDSGRNRLHVALSKIRKLGFRDFILRNAEGYHFAHYIYVTFVE